jgi:hypothetical protein
MNVVLSCYELFVAVDGVSEVVCGGGSKQNVNALENFCCNYITKSKKAEKE